MQSSGNTSCMGNNTDMTFKISLNCIYNSILYLNKYNSFKQEVMIKDKSLILDEIDAYSTGLSENVSRFQASGNSLYLT